MNKIYVSSSVLGIRNLEEVLLLLSECEIDGIELGSIHQYKKNILDVVLNYADKRINFTVHNYFPPHKIPFALNIASNNKTIRENSINHAKSAIDLCVKIRSPLYSMHSGMLADPKEISKRNGFIFQKEELNDNTYKQCFEWLIKSCKIINSYAKNKGIKFALENSGGHPSKYKYLLLARFIEFKNLIQEINDENFGILFDIGHYKVTSSVYESENIEKFIEYFKYKIYAVHLHTNDGKNDNHDNPGLQEINLISKFNKNTIITIETMNRNITEVKDLITLLKNTIGK